MASFNWDISPEFQKRANTSVPVHLVLTTDDNLTTLVDFCDCESRPGEYMFVTNSFGIKNTKKFFYFTDPDVAFEFKMNFGG